jgi:hypothetical protein
MPWFGEARSVVLGQSAAAMDGELGWQPGDGGLLFESNANAGRRLRRFEMTCDGIADATQEVSAGLSLGEDGVADRTRNVAIAGDCRSDERDRSVWVFAH